MILNHFLLLIEQDQIFLEYFYDVSNEMDALTLDCLWNFQKSFTRFNFQNSYFSTVSEHPLILFIDKSENSQFFKNLDNTCSIYHYSIPNTKLFYPEPFIAAASFMHSDLWFVHILAYQYWLWFVFIFIIVFFIITFLCIVRWCNMRTRPRRETRGVSRSKCGDLITAIVPVSWAASIIISESTDAIDYFDGFGTTEMVVGIRAYQWGWEYYYPKDIDLNYNIKKNHSAFFGNSLKYFKSTESTLNNNQLWKFYQNKPYDFVVTPAHLLLLPTDNFKILNFLNFSDVGTNAFHESSIFKHTRMFSKIFNSNLLFNCDDFNSKYNNVSPLFISDLNIYDSYLYGLKRQHTFINSKSFSNNFTTLFNLKNINKLFSYNYKFNLNAQTTFKGFHLLNFFRKQNYFFSDQLLVINKLWDNNLSADHNNKFLNFLFYPSLFEKLNNNSDKKKLSNPIFKIFKSNFNKIYLNNKFLINVKISLNKHLLSMHNNSNQLFNNFRFTKKSFTPLSINQAVVRNQQTVKALANLSTKKGNFNFNPSINSAALYIFDNNKNLNLNVFSAFKFNELKWHDFHMSNKMLSNRLYFDAPTSALPTNSPLFSFLDYDDYKFANTDDSFASHQSRDDLMAEIIYKGYNNLYINNTDLYWRINNAFNYNVLHNFFYFPLFTLSYDYDFRNWQSLSLLEDSYWESANSIYSSDEYVLLSDDFYNYNYFNKHDKKFNREDRLYSPLDNTLNKNFLFEKKSPKFFYSSSIYNEDALFPIFLLPLWEFFILPVSSNTILMDDSYEFIKQLKFFSYNNFKTFSHFTNSHFPAISYTFYCDNFKSDIEDFSWFFDKKVPLIDLNPLDLTLNFSSFFFKQTPFFSLFSKNFDFFHSTNNENNYFFDFTDTLRFTNFLFLRPTSRAATGTYNSYQKVYRPRFDENRTHAKTNDVINMFSKQPNITANKVKFEKLLGKNKENFFSSNLYKNELLLNFNINYDAFNSLNYYFFDFPFLLSLKSDASRYFWSDWFSRWGMYEVQPSSASRYAIMGLPFFNKNFDFNGLVNSDLTDAENYFVRIARARKNYLPTWTHTPYFYAKNVSFFKNNLIYETHDFNTRSVLKSKFFLKEASFYWNQLQEQNFLNYLYFPTNSGVNSFSRANWTPINTISSYYYNNSSLVDILTKREFLYREFLFSRKKIINLHNDMTNSPSNPLIQDFKSVFFCTSPINCCNEYSRQIYFNILNYFNFSNTQSSLLNFSSFLGLPLNFLLASPLLSSTNQNDLIKTQYRPMRKGITNMIRLHGTGAIAMPIEIRLQILASSKDVIHSWAIPSAGVKIDCVPGYSSHRVLIFLVSGIFWGQCMEVCGRYHHWMPIIVYFLKRDLFFLWCTHFVFLSGANNMWIINDRQFTNYGKTVSFNKNSWVNEIN